MNRLSRNAREEIRWAGLTVPEYARVVGWEDGRWHGDACGCPDDRCTGHHHDEGEACGCLAALLEDHLARSTRDESASQGALDLASDLLYARAQKRGERLARQMRRDGTLKAKSPRKVVRPAKSAKRDAQ